MANNEKSSALEFSRRNFDNVLDWYKNADTKAQIILSLDGAFLAFLTSFIFTKPDDLLAVFARFGAETWLLLGLMCLTFSGSIMSVIFCLRSRVYREAELDEMLEKGDVETADDKTYKAEFTTFFQFLSRLDAAKLSKTMLAADADFEIEALAYQTRKLSKNVIKKHKWVNRGFTLAGISLILFLGVAVSYLIRVGG